MQSCCLGLGPEAVVLGLDPRPNLRLNMRMEYYVYILASRPRSALYIGVTGGSGTSGVGAQVGSRAGLHTLAMFNLCGAHFGRQEGGVHWS
jgi:hypothetical protein